MMMDELLNDLEARGIKNVAYADDLLVLVEGNSRKTLEEAGTRAMEHIQFWGMNVGVQVSEQKSAVMMVKGRLSWSRPPIVKIARGSLPYVRKIKYLGVTVGERMNFKPHLNMLRSKVTAAVSCMHRVVRHEWGLKRDTMKTLYKGWLTPAVLYCASAWGDILKHKYGKELVRRVERPALYMCLGVCRTVSTAAMEVLLGELPWHLGALRRRGLYKVRKGITLDNLDLLDDGQMTQVTATRLKKETTAQAVREWQEEWNSTHTGRTTYKFIKDVTFAGNHEWFQPTVETTFLITGHGSLNKFLFERNINSSPLCACRKEEETSEHLLWSCQLYGDLRIRHIGDICLEDQMLENEEVFQRFQRYTLAVFKRRRVIVLDSVENSDTSITGS